ncbi:MAG: glycosyltransferase family 9 protein [Ignavibacteriaceae bacterium]
MINNVNKILCIKPRGIGDIVLSTIVLDNLKARFPSAKIDYLTEHFAKSAVENNPLVNKVITIDKKEFPLKAALKIRKEKYDMILDLWSNPRSAQITFLSGVKYRVGFAYRGRKYAYNILATSDKGEHHSAEHNLELLKVINVPVISKKIHYHVNENENNAAKDFIAENINPAKTIIGIIPSGGWPSKRCDASKWVEIGRAVTEKYEAGILIIWGPGDENDSSYIKENLPGSVLAPKTTVSEMSGYIKNCSIILANDSGPMHIAAALNIPTLGIFGPTNPKAHGPYSENSDYVIKEDLFCIICNLLECPYHHECMLQLPVDAVLNKIEKIGINILVKNE